MCFRRPVWLLLLHAIMLHWWAVYLVAHGPCVYLAGAASSVAAACVLVSWWGVQHGGMRPCGRAKGLVHDSVVLFDSVWGLTGRVGALKACPGTVGVWEGGA